MGEHKYPCAAIVASSCVPFSGKKPKFLTEDLECDANLNDVVDVIGDAIDDLKKAVDVSLHSAPCLSLTSPKTAANVLQAHADKLCALAATIQSLQTQVAAADVANELITINLGCLAPAAAPCQVGTNNYTLISILTLFKNEICAIKANLGI